MPSLYQYKLFISHSWSYSDDYNRVKRFLTDAANFQHADYSVPSSKAFIGLGAKELEEQLRNQIRPSQVVLIISGMYVAHRDWIQFEIDFAKQLGKPIVGIVPWGAERTPTAVQTAANEMVGWSTASIVDAIRRNVR